MSKHKITYIAFPSLFTAIICILSQISFATPTVPVTLQTLGIALCGFVLSAKGSVSCIATYLAIGSLGLPVFSSFQGGFQVLLGPNGGFLWGFILLTLSCSVSLKIKGAVLKWCIPFLGLLCCHILGIIQYSAVTGNKIIVSFLTASMPFVVKDVICVFLAFFLAKSIKKGLKGFNF